MTTPIKEVVLLDLDQLHPRDWNPNVMSNEQFNQLCEKIDEEGFTDPLKVCPVPNEELGPRGWDTSKKHYWIWAGEHRWRYAKVKGMTKVPTMIYENLDEEDQKLKMVRDNLVHGDLDAKKFTELARSIDPTFNIDPRKFGFDDRAEMDKFLIIDKDAREKTFLDGLMESADKKREAVDGLTDIVTNIFAQCAETVDQSYLHFTYKGNVHCVVLCRPETRKQVDEMLTHLNATGGDINDFMEGAIKEGLVQSVG